MMNRRAADYYTVLGVSADAEDVVLQAAYRALMRRYHPDANSDAEAAAKAKLITEAYAVLSDPVQRAAYDRDRECNGAQSESSRPPPSPPPPKSRYSDRANVSGPNRGIALTVGLLVMIGLAAFLANASDGAADIDNNMIVENLTAENLVVADDYDQFGQNNTAEAVATPSLSKAPQPQVEFRNIESASIEFTRLFMKSGISGARGYSERCHRAVSKTPTWETADNCAAFDYAAAYVDQQVSRSANFPPNGYFRFQATNQADYYTAAGASAYSLYGRLSTIKTAAEATAADSLAAELARAKTAEPEPVSPTKRDSDPFLNDLGD